VLALWAYFDGTPLWPEPEEWSYLSLLGLLFTVQIALLNWSLNLTSAAYAVVFVNSAPIFTNAIAHFFVPEDRLSRMRVLGLTLAFAGISVMFLGRPEARLAPHPLLGNVIATVTAMLIGTRLVYTQRLVQRIDSTKAIFWQVLLSVPLFLGAALLLERPTVAAVTGGPVAAILYQGLAVAGIGFILWVRLLRDHPPGALSVFVFPTPLFGVFFSALLFAEKLSLVLIVGVLAVAAGVLIVTWEPRERSPAEVPPPEGRVEEAA